MEEAEGRLLFEIDGLPVRLLSYADLSWLHGYGTVFRVMDDLDSGNLCFGVDGPYGRLFVKYAGAQTVRYGGSPEDAVSWLQYASQLHARFAHPSLVPMLTHGPVPGGYATVFPWLDAPPLRPLPPTDRVLARVRTLPLVRKLSLLDGVFDLHALLASCGLTAVDLTDEHILIDFENSRALVCDIDLYRRKPAFNTRGRMPGSPRFLAPEEYVMGDPLDDDTTVYKLGTLAFQFFGGPEKTRQEWAGPAALYPVAERAVREKRKERYRTVREFVVDWRTAVGEINL